MSIEKEQVDKYLWELDDLQWNDDGEEEEEKSNVELSRRVARLTKTQTFQDLQEKDYDKYYQMLDKIDQATSFESLPKNIQDLIVEAEKT